MTFVRFSVVALALLLALPVRADPRRTKVAGMALTISGSVLASGGAVLLGLSVPSDSPAATPNLLIPAFACAGVGLIALGVGIPLWVVGARKERRAAPVALVPLDSARAF
jgi:hypothetical protein